MYFLCFSSHKPMFQNKECDASVGSIAKAFVPTGMLNSDNADVVLNSLRQKYRDTDKLIVPRWVTVSIFAFVDRMITCFCQFSNCCCSFCTTDQDP